MDRSENSSGRLGLNPDRRRGNEISNPIVTDSSQVVNRDWEWRAGAPETPGTASAILTLAANQNAPYRVAPTKFGHSGFTLTQLKRVGNVAIYVQTKRRQPPAYEVVLIQKYEAYSAFGKEYPAGECYPSSEQWGTYGFTYRTTEGAERKFLELTGERRPS
jgi:hypothetical protein